MSGSSSASSFKAGLVGSGHISEFHASALRRCGVELVGVCDVSAERAAAAAAKFGTKPFGSAAELVKAGANVIHVLTPPETHATLALEALDLGCHVLVEKPLAVDVEDCRRVERRAAERGLQVCVNHSLLYDPQVRKGIEAVRSGKLGTVVSVDILRSSQYPPFAGGALPPQYRTAGYPFRDLGIHALYLFETFLGPIEDVRADWKSLGGDANLAFDEWRALVRCRDGLGQFQLSWNVRPMQSQIVIQGTKGVLRLDLFLMYNALRKSMPLPKPAERIVHAMVDSFKPAVDVPRGVVGFIRKKVLPYHGLQELVKHFYQSLESRRPAPVPVADAVRVVDWTERVARAADADHAKVMAALPAVSAEVPYLVTGASGALGGAVLARLREQGQRVRAMVRRVPAKVQEGVEYVVGDLGDLSAVDRAVKGAAIVIHAGAAMKGGPIEHECGTVLGTRHVLDACLKHGAKKLVHVSSMSVVDWAGAPADAPVDERTPFEPRAAERGAYTQAKLAAERLVSEFAATHDFPTVILRPGQIFGGRIPLLTPAVARRKGKGWLILGDGKLRLPLVYIDDVVDAIMLAAEGPLRSGEVVQLVDDQGLTQIDVLTSVSPEGPRVTRVPRAFLVAMGALSAAAFKLIKRQSPLAPYRLRSALARRTFPPTAGAALLGWTPRVGVVEGIRRMHGVAVRRAGERRPAATDAEPGVAAAAGPQKTVIGA